ncbi:MAG TPA: protease pro-enzyme activation domain-containing protein, partial [Acidimicrobiales bacterium]
PTDPDGFVIPVSGSADVVAHAFSTALSAVRLADGSTSYVQSGSASVPADLAPHITSVVGLSAASRYDRDAVVAPPPGSAGLAGARSTPLEPADPLELAQSTGAAGAAGCTAAQATGGTLQSSVAALYGFSDLFAQGRTGTGQTIALYELEGYSAADVEQFEQCFGRSATVSSVTVDGGPLPSAAAPGSGEAALDIENTLSFAPATRVVVYEGPNDGGVGPMDVYRRIADDDAAPVVATSWGICEAANGAAAEQAEAQIFDQMALDGQTVVAASGDAGSEDCYPQGPNATSLAVDDPGSQPTVTSVGGTALSPSAPAGQVVWNSCDGLGASCARSGGRQGAGGGGVSSTWALPSYQAARVLSPCPAGATTGTSDCRQVPDVAALAAPSPGYPIVWDGRWTTAGGTSAAAPLWAALFADADQGCNTPLGSVDPALYALGDAQAPVFGDVTTGDNDFLQTNGGQYGAGTGYDLASGWGSPESGALVAALQPAGGCPSVVGLSAPFGPLSGGTLTITGSGLGGASAVDVGALGPASIVADTPTSIT